MKAHMWIVVILDTFYPSIYHFDDEAQATSFYHRMKDNGYGHAVHLSEVKTVTVTDEEKERKFDEGNVEALNVEWHNAEEEEI